MIIHGRYTQFGLRIDIYALTWCIVSRYGGFGYGQVKVKVNVNGCSLSWFVINTDTAAHEFDKLACNRQSKPGAAMLACRRSICLSEGFEKTITPSCQNDLSTIFDIKVEACLRIGFTGCSAALCHGTGVCEFEGITNQVDEYLTQPLRITDNPVGYVGGYQASQFNTFECGLWGKYVKHVGQ